jgi:hypothetical protein
LQVAESTTANKDGFRLKRICVGTQKKVAHFEIVRRMDFKLQHEYILKNHSHT